MFPVGWGCRFEVESVYFCRFGGDDGWPHFVLWMPSTGDLVFAGENPSFGEGRVWCLPSGNSLLGDDHVDDEAWLEQEDDYCCYEVSGDDGKQPILGNFPTELAMVVIKSDFSDLTKGFYIVL